MTGNDDGGVKDMEVDSSITSIANDKKNQLPWVEKYRPSRYVI